MSNLGDCQSVITNIINESEDVVIKERMLDAVLETMEVYEDLQTMIEFINTRIMPRLHPQSKLKEYFYDKIHYYKLLIG